MIIRHELDRVRACLVEAFMVLYPNKFPDTVLLNKFNRNKRSIEWWMFKILINAFFKLHFRYHYETLEYFHTDSAFKFVDRDQLLLVDETPSDLHERGLVDPPSTRLFRERYYGTFSLEQDRSDSVPSESYMEMQITTFVPAFVWAYNELKAALAFDDVVLHDLMVQRELNQRQIIRKGGSLAGGVKLAGPASTPPSFLGATLSEIRKNWYWTKFHESLSKNAGSLNAELAIASTSKSTSKSTPKSTPNSLKRPAPVSRFDDPERWLRNTRTKLSEFGSVTYASSPRKRHFNLVFAPFHSQSLL